MDCTSRANELEGCSSAIERSRARSYGDGNATTKHIVYLYERNTERAPIYHYAQGAHTGKAGNGVRKIMAKRRNAMLCLYLGIFSCHWTNSFYSEHSNHNDGDQT